MRHRILMFGWEFPPFHSGGLGVACLGLTRALSEIGVDVTFVMPRQLDVHTPYARMIFADRGIQITTLAVNSLLSPYITEKAYLRGRRRAPQNIVYGKDLFSEVMRYAAMGGIIASEEEFDVIYAHDWLSFGAGMEAKRATGKPLIVHVHATEFDRCGGPWGVNQGVFEVERAGMEMADAVIAVSGLTKDIIINKYGIPAEKVRVVYNGIDDNTRPQGEGGLPRLRQLKQRGNKLVLFLGRVTLQKGPDYFIRAAKRVLEHNKNVYFILSGSGDMEASIMQLAARIGIADRVIFTGHLDGVDKGEVYRVADLFVMPSISEPFGITPLEAISSGTPVLISKQSGVSEVVRNALKVDFWDVDEMANKILSVIGYQGISETLVENATEEVRRLTWNQTALKVDGIVGEFVHG